MLNETSRHLLPLGRFAVPSGAVICMAMLDPPLPTTPSTAPSFAPSLLLVGGDTTGGVTIWELRSLLARREVHSWGERGNGGGDEGGGGSSPPQVDLQPLCREQLHSFGALGGGVDEEGGRGGRESVKKRCGGEGVERQWFGQRQGVRGVKMQW